MGLDLVISFGTLLGDRETFDDDGPDGGGAGRGGETALAFFFSLDSPAILMSESTILTSESSDESKEYGFSRPPSLVANEDPLLELVAGDLRGEEEWE